MQLPAEDTCSIDSGFVLDGSLHVMGYVSPTDFVQVGNKIVWLSNPRPDSIFVSYKKLHFAISYERKDKSRIYEGYEQNPFKYEPNVSGNKVDYGTLNTAGNISRGIGFGNAQDVVVNSNLNLRINGKLAGDVDVLAVISDENNPIQPEGNTQQIQDFDQVYITLKKDSTELTLGDFLMQRPSDSYFINYYKKSRGLQLKNVTSAKNWRFNTQAEAAISRGRFSRNRIGGIEGNSGPYRLTGDNGELFIVVIAGTENVYLDGKLLTRGEDNDYVVNYNTGEITFTPRILITRYSRIVVEFQYSDRNYGRSVVHLGTAATHGGFTIYANGFNEMDLKSQSFQQDLSGYDSVAMKSYTQVLAAAGDSQAFVSRAIQQSAYNNERIMYTKSTLGSFEIYTYASDPSENATFYEVYFSNVGTGKGSYRQAQTAANGKVFEYVGAGLGDYEPIEILIAPQRLNSLNVGVVYEEKGRKMGVEYTKSSLDKNTLSSLDDADNGGFGLKIFRTTTRKLKDSTWQWKTDANYELVSGQYKYIERYRGVEFDRQWNKVLTNPNAVSSLVPAFEHIANLSLGLSQSPSKFISNNTALFIRPGNFDGFSNLTQVGVEYKKFYLTSSLEVMNSGTQISDTSSLANRFYSIHTQLNRSLGFIQTGIGFTREKSSFISDTLQTQSYAFTNYSAHIANGDSAKLRYKLSANQRTDELPKNEGFREATIGRDVNLNTGYTSPKYQRIELNTTYRQLQIKDTLLSSKPIEKTLQSRLEMDFNFFKKFIKTRTFYQVGTGQEQRREFQFLQVRAGNGVYIWNDYDTNNLKTLNEFEIASDLDKQRADYIKIFTPVAGFFTTNTTKLSQTLELSPAVFFSSKSKNKPILARFNSLSTLILDKKILPTTILAFLNPLEKEFTDTTLISDAQSFRSTLFYNRGNPKFSMDYTYTEGKSKVLLTNGFDSRANTEQVLNTRISLGSRVTLDTRGVFGNRIYLSQFFDSRSYGYDFYEIEPKLQMVIKNAYRFELKTKYFNAANRAQYGGETSKNIELGGEFKYTQAGKGTLNAGASYINVNYDGSTSSSLGYELLRGLQNGNNATWKVGYQRTLANNIQVVLSYDGRQSETAPTIHIGRLVARYLF
jgi:hypothetical protein